MFLKALSAGTSLLVKLEKDLYSQVTSSDFASRYIPDYSWTDSTEAEFKKADVSLKINEDSNFSFIFNQDQGVLSYSKDNQISVEDIITVIDYCLEYARERNNIYCLHGSAVGLDGKGILLVGQASGLGKTTLSLNLCVDHQAKFVGDEKILINNKLELINGVKIVSYNKTSLFESVKVNLNNKRIGQNTQLVQAQSAPIKIKLVVQPLICPSAKEVEVEKWPELKANFHFYEDLSRKIRGVSRRVGKFSLPLPSLDNEILATKRSELANQIASNIPFFSIKGDIAPVMNEIIRLVS
ncbi:MAG: hypothetical protein ACOX50_00295 [Patescibacteria group bacterium]|jgi:hypothetical protein